MKDQKDRDKAWKLCYKRNGWKGEASRNKNTALHVRRFTMGKDRHFPCSSRGQCCYQRMDYRRQKNSPEWKAAPAHSGSCKAEERAS